jgi:uncharacterized protein YjiS (DUF1127 family)
MFASLHTAEFALTRTARGEAPFARLFARLRLALEARRERQALARLDADLLADLGLLPAQVEAESRRPFWDVPATWRR